MHHRSAVWNHALLKSRVDGRVTVENVCTHLGLEDREAVADVLDTMCDSGWLVKADNDYRPANPVTRAGGPSLAPQTPIR